MLWTYLYLCETCIHYTLHSGTIFCSLELSMISRVCMSIVRLFFGSATGAYVALIIDNNYYTWLNNPLYTVIITLNCRHAFVLVLFPQSILSSLIGDFSQGPTLLQALVQHTLINTVCG